MPSRSRFDGEVCLRDLFRVTSAQSRVARAGWGNWLWALVPICAIVMIPEAIAGWGSLWSGWVITGAFVVTVWGLYRTCLARIEYDAQGVRVVRALDAIECGPGPSMVVVVGRVAPIGLVWGKCRVSGDRRRVFWFTFSDMGIRQCAGAGCVAVLREALESVGVNVRNG